LGEFKTNFYDLTLTDVFMPSEKILKLDDNIRVCYISAAEVNIEAQRNISKSKKHRKCYKNQSK